MPKTMLERVLIPLDEAGQAESMLPLLEPLLRCSGSEVFFVRAIPRSAPVEEADGHLQGIADRFQRDGMVAHALVSVGPPQQVIESLACDEEITVIVMPVLGDAAPGPLMERLLRESTRPLVVLRPATGDDAQRPSLAPHRSILVPLDGSEASRRSLPLALELAASLEARLILLRVLQQPSDRIEAIRDLREIAERLNRQGFSAEIWLETGDPAERILQASQDPDVQLLAMTTQGSSSEGIMGGVTRQILNRSTVPVLAVHVRG
ncbi:MAG TPA: universal stress protein [Planctomycetota bacterium]|nr:universal stress protein [Planctomycetota bacterium]